MKYTHRVRRLESVWRCEPSCGTCGYPERRPRRIVNAPNRDPLPTCDGCGRLVDFKGWPLATPLVRVMRGERLFDPLKVTR